MADAVGVEEEGSVGIDCIGVLCYVRYRSTTKSLASFEKNKREKADVGTAIPTVYRPILGSRRALVARMSSMQEARRVPAQKIEAETSCPRVTRFTSSSKTYNTCCAGRLVYGHFDRSKVHLCSSYDSTPPTFQPFLSSPDALSAPPPRHV